MAKGDYSVTPQFFQRQSPLPKSTGGYPTWHQYALVYNSVTGAYDTYIDGQNFGGWTNQPYLRRVDVGTEITNSCSTIHMTYFGSPSPSSSYAFKYRVGVNGFWTTWGSGTASASHPPMHSEWQAYAIYMRAWGL
jgi:hypothetical protein